MGKEIDFSNAIYPNYQPMLEQSYSFMQNAAQEDTFKAANANHGGLYVTGDVLILYGCFNSGSGSTYNISAGVVLYNGKIYSVPAASFVAGVGQVAIANFATASAAFDPIKLKPGNTDIYVHIETTIVITAGSTGTGLKDYSAFKRNYGLITSTTPATTPTMVLSGGGPFAYTADTYKYAYMIKHGIMKLFGKITFTNTNGMNVEEFRMPLPDGFRKKTLTEDFATRGKGAIAAPTSTSNYCDLDVASDSDGSEGTQRIILKRYDGGTTTFDFSAGKTAIIRFGLDVVLDL